MVNFDVVTFGSGVVDAFVDTDLAERRGFMVYPVGSKILLKNLRFDVGGGGTNTAVAFARMGLKTGWIGKTCDDSNGKVILELLKKEKIQFLGKIVKGEVSGYSVILDSKENNRTILTYKGVNDNIKISDIQLNKLKTKWLYFSSLLGTSFETQKKLAKIMHMRGVKIAFNPSDYLIKRKNLSGILKFTEILVLNHEEAQILVKKKFEGDKLFRELRELGPKIVVVTNKNKRTFAYDGKKTYSILPHKVKVVERTGAGDAFASGFVVGQIAGKSLSESLELGLAESESVIKYFGAKNRLIKKNIMRQK